MTDKLANLLRESDWQAEATDHTDHYEAQAAVMRALVPGIDAIIAGNIEQLLTDLGLTELHAAYSIDHEPLDGARYTTPLQEGDTLWVQPATKETP